MNQPSKIFKMEREKKDLWGTLTSIFQHDMLFIYTTSAQAKVRKMTMTT